MPTSLRPSSSPSGGATSTSGSATSARCRRATSARTTGSCSEALLDRLVTQPTVHRIHGELGAPEAAELYDRELDGVTLDLALNGIGADGHTASLFPSSPALDERELRAVAAEPGLEPFVERVTLTPPVFARDAPARLPRHGRVEGRGG